MPAGFIVLQSQVTIAQISILRCFLEHNIHGGYRLLGMQVLLIIEMNDLNLVKSYCQINNISIAVYMVYNDETN